MHRSNFEQLALQQLDAVYRMALQLTRHPDEASDLVQETYLKAITACESFQERGGGMRPWLFKILHNAFYSRCRRSKRAPFGGEHVPNLPTDDGGPDDPEPAWDIASFDWEHVDDRLKAAIDDLKPEYRTVLLMWGVEGMKYREIAEIQDVPIGTVMSRLHRARSILAAELADLAEESGIAQR